MLLLTPNGNPSGAQAIAVGQSVYPVDASGTITLPTTPLQTFSGFNPLDLGDLQAMLLALQVGQTGFVTLASLRALQNPSTSFQYYMVEPGRLGPWYYDPLDTTTLDDTGTCVVTQEGKRMKRNYSGFIRASWFIGLAQNIDVSRLFKNLAFRLGQANITMPVLVEGGTTYRWDTSVTLTPYGLDLRCPYGTSVFNSTPDVALWATRPIYCEGIDWIGNGGDPPLVNGQRSTNAADYEALALVRNSAVSTFRRCSFKRSRGNGAHNDGNIQERTMNFPTGSNSSRARYYECNFQENQGSGYSDRGFDANLILVDDYNSTDNGRYGLEGSAFLGGRYSKGHTNNNVLGGHRIENQNNRAIVDGAPYEEDGQPGSFINGFCTIIADRFTQAHAQKPYFGPNVLRLTPRASLIPANY